MTKEELMEELDQCGCCEDDVLLTDIIKFLEWGNQPIDNRPSYKTLFKELGYFYVLGNLLNDHNYFEHGTSLRVGWTTQKGIALLNEPPAA